MSASIIDIIVFFMCFGLCFYAISSVHFDRFCSVKEPGKVRLLMFLLSLALAYICQEAILQLTIYNGLGI